MTLGSAVHRGRRRRGRWANLAVAAGPAAHEGPPAVIATRPLLLRKQLEWCREEQALLEARVAELEQEARRIFAKYVEAEVHGVHFANLFLTVQRLRGARDRDEICDAVREIVENLIGSDEIAVFERSEDGSAFLLTGAFGIDPAPYAEVPLGAGIIGHVALTGEPYFRESAAEAPGAAPGAGAPSPSDDEVTACVPLTVEGRTTGALTLFRMLPQKPALSFMDHEILDVLASYVAAALHDSARSRRAGEI